MLGGSMKLCNFVALLLLTYGCDVKAQRSEFVHCDREDTIDGTIYDYTIPDVHDSQNISLSDYRGKQEPGANGTEIMNGIQYVRPGSDFVPNFQLFNKLDVNGKEEHPLFTFLKKHCPSTRDGFASKDYLFYSPMKVNDIRWNFEKFLINQNGKPVKRFDASTNPEKIEAHVVQLLTEGISGDLKSVSTERKSTTNTTASNFSPTFINYNELISINIIKSEFKN
ncbi:hypothetical protein L9F63_002685 [Diploptera punctata]|uniref:Glutathione peroxidase n=1 Tax=Diploptera punctata TaxID=6984 RepID=A0AAD7ZRE6_DIPPU|nr:hypothetical protein L9F63_002685 [Diploptera punctata]